MKKRTVNRITLLCAAALLPGILLYGAGRAHARYNTAASVNFVLLPETMTEENSVLTEEGQTVLLDAWIIPAAEPLPAESGEDADIGETPAEETPVEETAPAEEPEETAPESGEESVPEQEGSDEDSSAVDADGAMEAPAAPAEEPAPEEPEPALDGAAEEPITETEELLSLDGDADETPEQEPEPTPEPTPESTPEPEVTPEPVQELEETAAPEDTPEPTPEPEETVEPEPTVEPENTPEPTPLETAEPEPAETPGAEDISGEKTGETKQISFTIPANSDTIYVEYLGNSAYFISADLSDGEDTAVLELSLLDTAIGLTEPETASVRVSDDTVSADFVIPLVPEGTEEEIALSDQDDWCRADADILAALMGDAGSGSRSFRVTDYEEKPITGLRFSIDGGETWSMLQGVSDVTFEAPEGWNGLILFDVSMAEEGLSGVWVTTDRGDVAIGTLPDVQLDDEPFFLTDDGAAKTLTVQTDWLGCELEPTLWLLKLSRGDFGWDKIAFPDQDAYRSPDEPDPPVWVTVHDDRISISIPDGVQKLRPGTYDLTLRWKSGDTIIYQKEIEFFVSYDGFV